MFIFFSGLKRTTNCSAVFVMTSRSWRYPENAFHDKLKNPNDRDVLIFNRWVSVVEFFDGALGIGKVVGQESTVVKWNYQILSLHLVTVCQKVPILDFQSEFSVSKIIRIFLSVTREKFHFLFGKNTPQDLKSCVTDLIINYIIRFVQIRLVPNYWSIDLLLGWRFAYEGVPSWS